MPLIRSTVVLSAAACLSCVVGGHVTQAAKVTVELSGPQGATFVGAFHRWDVDGNLRRPVNPKAKIDAPEVDASATNVAAGRWVFDDLPAGDYDLVIMCPGRVRIEGWTYAPVLEFDPFFPPDASVDDEVRQFIADDIGKSRHYENKVGPLYMGGDDKVTRVLVMLSRDQPTSYERHMPGAASMRFEIWQYDWQYGGWMKNKRTKVFHRLILPRDELRQWTWLWDPNLGGIKVGGSPVSIKYETPEPSDSKLKGLRPY